MIKKFKTYIEQEPWDEEIERHMNAVDNVCIAILVLTVLFFVPVFAAILAR